MAHVIHSINTTVSGSCHHADAVVDEDHHAYALDLLKLANAVLLGRNTFDLFASFWPEAAHRRDLPSHMIDFAIELDAKAKYVLSSRGLETAWKNTELLQGPGLGEAKRLIHGARGTVVVFGSPALGASLAAAELIDEIHVVIQPFIGVESPRAFEGLSDRKKLSLLEARPFRSGAVLLRYAEKYG